RPDRRHLHAGRGGGPRRGADPRVRREHYRARVDPTRVTVTEKDSPSFVVCTVAPSAACTSSTRLPRMSPGRPVASCSTRMRTTFFSLSTTDVTSVSGIPDGVLSVYAFSSVVVTSIG